MPMRDALHILVFIGTLLSHDKASVKIWLSFRIFSSLQGLRHAITWGHGWQAGGCRKQPESARVRIFQKNAGPQNFEPLLSYSSHQ